MNTITKLSAMLREKRISAVELAKAYLTAAQRHNAEFNAFITFTEETALSAAAEVDKRISAGCELPPLAGIPFILKDNIVTKGIKTTCASKMLENHTPIYNATAWEYLRDEGAVLIGKGNMDEFAMGSTGDTSYFGPARNPHDTSRTAGGSSGGSAAAVAGGLAVFGIGSDTGGSIRQPASFCGITGLKPTYGAVSRSGLIAFASSLDQIGPLSVCVEDAATVFAAISRPDRRDMTCKGSRADIGELSGDIRGLRIGIAGEFYDELSSDIGAVMDNALKTFADMGAVLVPVSFPLLRSSLAAYYVLACAEASSNLGRYDGLRYGHSAGRYDGIDDYICKTRGEGFGAEVRRRILLGTCVLSSGFYDDYYNKAAKLRNAIKNEYASIFKSCDCLITPTTPVTALKRVSPGSPEPVSFDIYTVSANIAGLPAVSIPCGSDDSNMPVGMQLIGNRFREDVILSAALGFERESSGAYIRINTQAEVKL